MKNKIEKILKVGIVRTVIFNFMNFNFRIAIKFPVILSKNAKFKMAKNSELTLKIVKFGIIKIGFGNVGFVSDKEETIIENKKHIIFNGKANIGKGSKISNNGIMVFGDKFCITAKSYIWCEKKITFGDNVLISWDNMFMDTDGHKIKYKKNNKIINPNSEIYIGNNVWIGCRSLILKGTVIGNNNVISANSKISGKSYSENKILGNNLKVIKDDIYWE
ncbi:MAG: acyltransferase [Cetobacterium sp.]|uniref:acyltransferase n=1 Tax=Cetobacterium sp. TaxID=2071632 RepID=UPI003F4144D0